MKNSDFHLRYRQLVTGFASRTGIPAPQFNSSGACAYTLANVNHFEISPNPETNSLVFFCEANVESSDLESNAREWFERSHLYGVNLGVFVVSVPNQPNLFLVRHLPIELLDDSLFFEAADSLLNVLFEIQGEDRETTFDESTGGDPIDLKSRLV